MPDAELVSLNAFARICLEGMHREDEDVADPHWPVCLCEIAGMDPVSGEDISDRKGSVSFHKDFMR